MNNLLLRRTLMTYTTNTLVQDFKLKNHDNVDHQLSMMMGERGILLGFTGDVWDVSCVRYVLWLQRRNFKLSAQGINCAMIVPNQSYELNGFYLSIPRDIKFPLLADPAGDVYNDFGMEQPGYVLLNHAGEVLQRWYIGDAMSMSMRNIEHAIR